MKSKIFLLLCLCGLTACSEKKSELDLAYEALNACLDKVIADTPKPQNTNDLQKLFEKEKAYCIDKAEKIDVKGGNSLQYIQEKNNQLLYSQY